jgi:Mg/Co/Ni transporter MgtE
MADVETLTLAYVASHPGDAARVLEGVAAAQAAAVFARLPVRAAAPVLVAMLPHSSAGVLGAVSDHVALALLTGAGARGAVAMLRHVPEPRRKRLIEGLPTATAIAARLLLGYPEDSVGAWADPSAVALAPTLYPQDVLDRVRGEPEAGADRVYIVGEDQRLLGVVDLATLVRAPDWRPVETLMRAAEAVLPAVMPLAAAAAHPAWTRTSELPVVARGGRLIGVLRQDAVNAAMARDARRAEEGEITLAGFAARGYWNGVSAMIRACLALLPRATPVAKEEP